MGSWLEDKYVSSIFAVSDSSYDGSVACVHNQSLCNVSAERVVTPRSSCRVAECCCSLCNRMDEHGFLYFTAYVLWSDT